MKDRLELEGRCGRGNSFSLKRSDTSTRIFEALCWRAEDVWLREQYSKGITVLSNPNQHLIGAAE